MSDEAVMVQTAMVVIWLVRTYDTRGIDRCDRPGAGGIVPWRSWLAVPYTK